jgi:hypothetical protein
MDALILTGSALLTVLAVAAIAIVVSGARADRSPSERGSAPAPGAAPPARGRRAPARRFRRQARARSSARR